MRILILNGPNLNLTGTREPHIYGTESFDAFIPRLQAINPEHELEFRQSNWEGKLMDWLQGAESEGFDGIVINPGAFAHTSYAMAETLATLSIPVIEVHLSNPHAREPFRHHTRTGAKCRGVIVGFGMNGYLMAFKALVQKWHR
jgi:3-dehydroquinate dehydratase II